VVAPFPAEPADLLTLVFARPREALVAAEAVLANSPTAYDASVAHQAIGLVHREFGDLGTALIRLRRARELARRSASAEREADVLASLGIALVHAGRTGAGLGALHRAAEQAGGVPAARVRFRLGGVLWTLGRHREALAEVRAALPVLRRAGDAVWTARALTLRALIRLALGVTDRAEADLRAAEGLFASTSQDHDSVVALHNRGLVAVRVGDLPAALTCLDEAERRYRLLGTPMPEVVIDRCGVFLTAGMPAEALADAEAALVARRRGKATGRAELLLVAARAALAGGQPAIALEHAGAAGRLFAAQRREWWRVHARLVVLQARLASAQVSGRLLTQADAVAARLVALGSPEAVQARLLAGRVALRLGRPTEADRHLAEAARARRHGTAIARADGWLAQALRATADGRRRHVLAACRRGLDLLDEHRRTFGASELRARATARGAELGELALRTSLGVGRARELLAWSERCRATACVPVAARSPAGAAAVAELAALREVTDRIRQARERGADTARLERDQRQLERRVRARALRAPGGAGVAGRLDVGRLLAELGDHTRLLELVEIAGDLHVLVCGGGQVRRVPAGTRARANREVELARWVLRRLAYAAGPDPDELWARTTAVGARLQRVLLGPAVRYLGDGPVVIVPPGWLQAVPWAALPALTDRVHGVAPSAAAWLAARTAPARSGGVVLVRGPGLASHGREVAALAGMYGGARLLQDGTATAQGVLDALDGSALAHIAAHGAFRADNPLFSAIRLDDGPLNVYDFERLHRAPYRLVLPSCDSGRMQPVGADELLGLAAALLPLGTAGIVASLVPVNDEATVPVMLALHGALAAGASLAEGLRHARRAVPDDPVHRATAWSYVAVGAA
jgi:tetratricopeptide (TPR) repeat protein